MKIECHCGELIVDQTDDLPHKGHLIPDQEWFATLDSLEAEVIDALADGRLSREAASMTARRIMSQVARLMYQCRSCGRLYIDDRQRNLQCYGPQTGQTAREVLRGRDSPT